MSFANNSVDRIFPVFFGNNNQSNNPYPHNYFGNEIPAYPFHSPRNPGFWPQKWSDLGNIWTPVGGNRNNPPREEMNSSGIITDISENFPPKHILNRYVIDYMREMWGVRVLNFETYIRAFTHKSYVSNPQNNNERLEFLGDSVLQIIMTEYLYHKFPQKSEGFLTKVRMKLINGTTLSEIGYKIHLNKMIRISSRLKQINKKLIEDAFEAVTCVIYQEHGLEYTKKVLIKLYEKYVNFSEIVIDNNYKEILLKYSQKTKINGKSSVIEYTLVDEIGPAHLKIFRVQVNLSGKLLGVGTGSTRKGAEQNAARESLIILGFLNNDEIDS